MNMTTVPSNQLKAMQHEIADLKEQITNAKYNYLGAMADCKRYEETIAQQAEEIRMLKQAVQHEADCVDAAKETIEEQAEAIRVSVELMQEVESKYFALLKEKDTESDQFKAGGDMCGWNFHQGMRSGAVNMHIYMTKLIKHLALQPSPEILQARDERVAEACKAACENERLGEIIGDSDQAYENAITHCSQAIDSKEWRKYL